MEDGTKKVVLIVVIAVCIAAAGAITYMTMGGGSQSTAGPAGSSKAQLKCNNPNCGYEYLMDRKEFTDIAFKNGPRFAAQFGALPVKCPKCGEESVFEAIKCEKCGKVFFAGAVEGPYDDKCPGCGFSKKEEAAKKQTPDEKK